MQSPTPNTKAIIIANQQLTPQAKQHPQSNKAKKYNLIE